MYPSLSVYWTVIHLLSQDEVKNEIGVMNQLNHVNLIQLYDAFETRTNLILIME